MKLYRSNFSPPSLKLYGTTIVNLLGTTGKSVADTDTVSFSSVNGHIYFDSLHDLKISGDGTEKTITNDTSATADIAVYDLTAMGDLDPARAA